MSLVDETIARIPLLTTGAHETAVRARWDSLTKPRGSLGRLEDAVVRLAEIQERNDPSADRQAIYVFCGDHGVCEEGVSAFPSIVTREMMKNFVTGGAAINVLCDSLKITTRIIDAGVSGPKIDGVADYRVGDGTRNFAIEPALSERELQTALEAGIKLAIAASELYEVVGLGEMGIGNSTAAAALLCALTGLSPEQGTGRGTGLDDAGLMRKRRVIFQALELHKIPRNEPLRILRTFGGFEIAMMAGFLLGAAANRLPSVVDGFISSASFLMAWALAPQLDRYVFFAHESAEPGHSHLLSYVGAKPLLNLGMRLGEGTGAALAMHILRTAVGLFNRMATFEEAAISGSVEPQAKLRNELPLAK